MSKRRQSRERGEVGGEEKQDKVGGGGGRGKGQERGGWRGQMRGGEGARG